MTMREQAEKFLIERREKPPERPTIAELEKIINSEDPTPIDIHADGSVGVGARERDIALICEFADSISSEKDLEIARLKEALEEILGCFRLINAQDMDETLLAAITKAEVALSKEKVNG